MAFLVDAMLNGHPVLFANDSFFFRGREYVRWNWTSGSDSPKPLSEWRLPAPFDSGVDVALQGGGSFTNLAYFFRAGQYVSRDWQSGAVSQPAQLTAWRLPNDFLSGVDAAINGDGAQAGKAFFFKGTRYVTYNWSTKTTTGPFPLLPAWNLSGIFRKGVHGAINGQGQGQFRGKAFFFRGCNYQGYDWATNRAFTGTLHLSDWRLRFLGLLS